MYRLFLPLLCASAIAIAAPETNGADSGALLEKVRIQMIQNLMRLPNYTCLQTIERTRRRAPARRFELVDMIRLEVALVSGRELFSWPGAGKFDEKEIDQIVTGGAIGNGNFALHAKSVFQGSPQYKFGGEEMADGRRLLRWDYRVGVLSSGYRIKVGGREAVVGYHGSFWVDAASLDVTRIEVEADDIPLDLQVLRAGDSVDYMRADIGGKSFLLPKASELHMLNLDNTENVNRIRFNSCHEYLGESKLIFSDPDANTIPLAETAESIELPDNLSLHLKLETPIRWEVSAVGDPVSFRLDNNLRVNGATLFEKGAIVHGRITLLRKHRLEGEGYALGILLYEIQSAVKRAAINARVENSVLFGAGFNSNLRSGGDFTRQPVVVESLPKAPGSVLFVRGATLNLSRGTLTHWRTVRDTNDGDTK